MMHGQKNIKEYCTPEGGVFTDLECACT